MAGERAALMATDPPYLVDYDGGNHPQTWGKDGKPISAEEKTKHWDAYTDHDQASGFFRDFLAAALEQALATDAAVYQCFGMMRTDVVLEAWRAAGLLPHQVVIWKKSRPVLGRVLVHVGLRAYAGRAGTQGDRPKRKPPANEHAVWEIASARASRRASPACIPTIKPVELVRRPIVWHTPPGGLIYEPFSGSGTALIAAEMTGRSCYALELSPAFVDVAVRRWERSPARQATLERAKAGWARSDQPDAPPAAPTIVICRPSSCARRAPPTRRSPTSSATPRPRAPTRRSPRRSRRRSQSRPRSCAPWS